MAIRGFDESFGMIVAVFSDFNTGHAPAS